jgi:hypothetical protein
LATSAQSIGWQKTGPHKYIRSLDAIERSLKYVYDDLAPPGIRSQDILTTAHINLDRGPTLEPVIFETLMRRAWARVSLLHPAVAATFLVMVLSILFLRMKGKYKHGWQRASL